MSEPVRGGTLPVFFSLDRLGGCLGQCGCPDARFYIAGEAKNER